MMDHEAQGTIEAFNVPKEEFTDQNCGKYSRLLLGMDVLEVKGTGNKGDKSTLEIGPNFVSKLMLHKNYQQFRNFK